MGGGSGWGWVSVGRAFPEGFGLGGGALEERCESAAVVPRLNRVLTRMPNAKG